MRPATLQAITGWQEERRRALVLLKAQEERAKKANRWSVFDALLFARIDVQQRLREAAAATITESCQMQWAHEVMR